MSSPIIFLQIETRRQLPATNHRLMQEIRKKKNGEKIYEQEKKRGYRNILLKIDRVKDGKRAAFAKITSNRSKIDEIQVE